MSGKSFKAISLGVYPIDVTKDFQNFDNTIVHTVTWSDLALTSTKFKVR